MCNLSCLSFCRMRREYCNPAGRQKQTIRVAAFPYCPSCVSVSSGKAVSPSREAYFDLQEETSTRLEPEAPQRKRERE